MKSKQHINERMNVIDYKNKEDYPCPIPMCSGTMKIKEDGFMSKWMECDKCGHKSYSLGF